MELVQVCLSARGMEFWKFIANLLVLTFDSLGAILTINTDACEGLLTREGTTTLDYTCTTGYSCAKTLASYEQCKMLCASSSFLPQISSTSSRCHCGNRDRVFGWCHSFTCCPYCSVLLLLQVLQRKFFHVRPCNYQCGLSLIISTYTTAVPIAVTPDTNYVTEETTTVLLFIFHSF